MKINILRHHGLMFGILLSDFPDDKCTVLWIHFAYWRLEIQLRTGKN